jgi:hypothetical protein
MSTSRILGATIAAALLVPTAYAQEQPQEGAAVPGGLEEMWNLQAYVRNFSDEVVFSRIAQNNVVHVQEYQFAPPRTYGLRFQYNF